MKVGWKRKRKKREIAQEQAAIAEALINTDAVVIQLAQGMLWKFFQN